jgi:ABC-type multidrug transport system ATPase subunit
MVIVVSLEPMDAIAVERLTKTYKPLWPWEKPAPVLSDVSLSVREGEIFGLWGTMAQVKRQR